MPPAFRGTATAARCVRSFAGRNAEPKRVAAQRPTSSIVDIMIPAVPPQDADQPVTSVLGSTPDSSAPWGPT